MKKIVGIILAGVVLIGFFMLAPKKKQNDPNTIVVWHWMTDRHEFFQQLAEQYQQQTGVRVEMELYAPSDAYSQKIIVAAQAKVLPDIFGILDKKEIFAAFIKNGFVADLTDEFKANDSAWSKALFKKTVDVNRFDASNVYGVKPGIYGVPLDAMNIQMIYNKKLLKKAGFDYPPQTFDEFLDVVKVLNRIGVSGFVSGWGELWMMDCFASNYAFNIMGEEKIMATYRGEVPYTDPDWIKVFDVFKILSDSGALIEDIVIKTNKSAEQDFALERAVFAFNGSWCVNVYQKMNPDLEYAPMLPPSIVSQYPMKIWGVAGSSLVVNNHSAKKDKAIAFLKWLTEKKQQEFLVKTTQNLPTNKQALGLIPEVLAGFAQAANQTTHPTIWRYNESALVTDAFDKGIQSIIIGDKTSEQVARDVQAVKQKIMSKEKKRKQRK